MHSDMVGLEEIVGDDLLGDGFVGSDSDGLLGAWYSLKKSGQAAKADAVKAVIDKRVRAGAMVRDVQPTKSREFIVGFGQTDVDGNDTVSITKQPQVLFRPERIVIPSNIALDFILNDVKVGKDSQFTASGEVPAVVFQENAFGVRLKMDTCQVSMQIILNVTNLSAETRTFMAAIIGPAVE